MAFKKLLILYMQSTTSCSIECPSYMSFFITVVQFEDLIFNEQNIKINEFAVKMQLLNLYKTSERALLTFNSKLKVQEQL